MIDLRCPDGQAATFFHAPKTGGTWVEHVVELARATTRRTGQHDPAWANPGEGLRSGTTRDPWTGYFSLYRHACDGASRSLSVYGRGKTDFRSVLWGWTHPQGLAIQAQPVGAIWHPVAEGAQALDRADCGLWTWSQRYHYGSADAWFKGGNGWAVRVLLQQSHLADAVREVFGIDGAEVARVNTRGITDYRGTYDPEMIRWVEEADGALAEELGQRPFEPARQPVVWLTQAEAYTGRILVLRGPPGAASPPYLREPADGDSIAVFRGPCAGWPFTLAPLQWEAMGGRIEGSFMLEHAEVRHCPRTMTRVPVRMEIGVAQYVAGVFRTESSRPASTTPLAWEQPESLPRVWFTPEGAFR